MKVQSVDQSQQLKELIQKLNLLRSGMIDLAASGLIGATRVHPNNAASARNLMHYVALRRHDIRQLQSQLAGLGLSSLGRTESHVLGSLDAVINVLHKLVGSDESTPDLEGAQELGEGTGSPEKNTEALLGAAPPGRNVRIMVTMPPEAATDYELVRPPSGQGMDCMRINCAHDVPDAWSGMIQNLRRAEKRQKTLQGCDGFGRTQAATGSIEPGQWVLKIDRSGIFPAE